MKDKHSISETKHLEYKEIFNDSVFKSLAGFANADGGTVVIGICDDSTVKGVNYSSKDIETLTNRIVDKLGIHPEIELIKKNGKSVLEVSVKKSTVPISFEGRYYKRVGNTTRELKTDELKCFLIKGLSFAPQKAHKTV